MAAPAIFAANLSKDHLMISRYSPLLCLTIMVAVALLTPPFLPASAEQGSHRQTAYSLRKSSLKAGVQLKQITRLDMPTAKAQLSASGRGILGTFLMEIEEAEDLTVLENTGGYVTAYKERITRRGSRFALALGGAGSGSRKVDSPLVGKVFLHRYKDGKWEQTEENQAVSSSTQNLQDTDGRASTTFENYTYPLQPVRPGYTWHLESDRLGSSAAGVIGGRGMSGDMELKFVRVTTWKGVRCAQIAVTLQVLGELPSGNGSSTTLDMEGRGTIYRSLDQGIDLQTTIKGTIQIEGDDPGQSKLDVSVRGPFTLTQTVQVAQTPAAEK